MKRCLTKLVVFLLLGAIVNVAVAWGCALSLSLRSQASGRSGSNGLEIWVGVLPENKETWGMVWTIHRPGAYKFLVEWGSSRGSSYGETPPKWVLRIMDEHTLDPRSGNDLVVDARGWPFPGLYSLADFDNFQVTRGLSLPSNDDSSSRWTLTEGSFALPIDPIWPGFAINTIFYAATLWLLTLGSFAARRMIRRKRGHCIRCGYDLRANYSAGCPECGWRREARA